MYTYTMAVVVTSSTSDSHFPDTGTKRGVIARNPLCHSLAQIFRFDVKVESHASAVSLLESGE